MKRTALLSLLAASACLFAQAQREIVEISVVLKLDESAFVTGERVRGVIDVKNMSPDTITVDGTKYDDRLFVEVFRASGMVELSRARDFPFVSPFRVGRNQGQLLETIVSDHYVLEDGRYLVRPVLVHNKIRYEGEYKVFDVVPGIVVQIPVV